MTIRTRSTLLRTRSTPFWSCANARRVRNVHHVNETTPTLTLNRPAWDTLMASHGLDTGAKRAAHLGVNPSTVSRIETGALNPGGRFVAAVMRAFPRIDPWTLFDPAPSEDAAA